MQIRVSGVEEKAHGKRRRPETGDCAPEKKCLWDVKFLWDVLGCEIHEEKHMTERQLGGFDGCHVAPLTAYLRQSLHNGVQQSPHPHRHLQELQYCGDTSTRAQRMKTCLYNINIVQSYITEQGLVPSHLL